MYKVNYIKDYNYTKSTLAGTHTTLYIGTNASFLQDLETDLQNKTTNIHSNKKKHTQFLFFTKLSTLQKKKKKIFKQNKIHKTKKKFLKIKNENKI